MPPAALAPPVHRAFSASAAAAAGTAAAAMVATLPGRTHGLGLVTEPLLADLGVVGVGLTEAQVERLEP